MTTITSLHGMLRGLLMIFKTKTISLFNTKKVFVYLVYRDTKRQMIRERNETLIVVPCWWEGAVERYYVITFYNITYLWSA